MSTSATTLVLQYGAAPASARMCKDRSIDRLIRLGVHSATRDDVGGVERTELVNPWLLQREQQRIDQALRRAREVVDALAGPLGLLDQPASLREVLVHEFAQGWLQDLVVGLREAEFVAPYIRPEESVQIGAASGIRGAAFEARLSKLRDLSGVERREATRCLACSSARRLVGQLRFMLNRPRPALTDLGSAPVLIVELYANRLAHMRSVIDAWNERDQPMCVLSLATNSGERTRLEQMSRQIGVPIVDWTAMLSAAMMGAYARDAAGVLGAYAQVLATIHRLFGRREGLPMGLVGSLADNCVRSWLRVRFVRDILAEAFAQIEPALVLTARGNGTNLRLLGLAGLQRGVPVLDIQHGLRAGCPPGMLSDYPGVDFALGGELARQAYSRAGVARERLHVVGSPIYERTIASRSAALPKPIEAPYFVYCSSHTKLYDNWQVAEPHRQLLQAFDHSLEAFAGHRLVVTLHPQEYHGQTRGWIDRLTHRDRIIVVEHAENGSLFGRADAQISMGSTTAVEALVVGTPAIYFDPFDAPLRGFGVPPAELGLVYLTQPRRLTQALHQARQRCVDIDQIRRQFGAGRPGASTRSILGLDMVTSSLNRR